jgi:hypothetical protein
MDAREWPRRSTGSTKRFNFPAHVGVAPVPSGCAGRNRRARIDPRPRGTFATRSCLGSSGRRKRDAERIEPPSPSAARPWSRHVKACVICRNDRPPGIRRRGRVRSVIAIARKAYGARVEAIGDRQAAIADRRSPLWRVAASSHVARCRAPGRTTAAVPMNSSATVRELSCSGVPRSCPCSAPAVVGTS